MIENYNILMCRVIRKSYEDIIDYYHCKNTKNKRLWLDYETAKSFLFSPKRLELFLDNYQIKMNAEYLRNKALYFEEQAKIGKNVQDLLGGYGETDIYEGGLKYVKKEGVHGNTRI